MPIVERRQRDRANSTRMSFGERVERRKRIARLRGSRGGCQRKECCDERLSMPSREYPTQFPTST